MADPTPPERVPSAALSGPPPKKSPVVNFLVIGLCVGVGGFLVLGVLAALLIPAFVKANRTARITACMSNLRQMYAVQNIYVNKFGGKEKEFPTETGSAFWLKLTLTDPPLLDPTEADILLCPVLAKSVATGCDFQGPSRPYKSLEKSDPIGADRPGNHPKGGNVLRKAGDVVELLDAEFSSACGKLSP